MAGRLAGKVCVITGAASGIGKACCEGLAEAGVKIVVADVNEETGHKTVERLKLETIQ